ncbi:MAG: hypothetical protein ACREOB_06375, partial [Thermodesulfobacteriota bacterium]
MRIVERYRPSLEIISALASVGLPRHRSFVSNTFNQARNLMSQPMGMGVSGSAPSIQGGSEFERFVRAIAGK